MSTTTWEAVLAVPVSPARDHIRGLIDAPLTLLEYGDYECSYCGAAHPIMRAIQAQLKDTLRFVFRHFPLTTVHPHAEMAAEAAEAAGEQRKFWPMHDMLYANQDRLGPEDLMGHAAALKLDLAEFRNALAERRYAAKVRDDFMSGVRSGVNGTPALYVNGVRHDGSWDFASLLTALQQPATAVRV